MMKNVEIIIKIGLIVKKEDLENAGWRRVVGFGNTDLYWKGIFVNPNCLLWRPKDEMVTMMFCGDDSYSH